MNEKLIIKGTSSQAKIIPMAILVIGILLFLITAVTGWSWDDIVIPMYIVSCLVIALGLFMLYYVNSCEICVTDKRVYGTAAFGTRVDIPLDSISAVGIISLYKGIGVSSSSGRIKFFYIDNAEEIHSAISNILLNRQNKDSTFATISKENSVADELKKFKDLLDCGVITQSEFEEKKKQLLK